MSNGEFQLHRIKRVVNNMCWYVVEYMVTFYTNPLFSKGDPCQILEIIYIQEWVEFARRLHQSVTNSKKRKRKERRTVIPNPLACKSPLNPGVNEGANGGPGVKVGTYTYESVTSGGIRHDRVTNLIGLETSHPQRPQMRTIGMACEKRLRECDDPVNHLLFVHVPLCGPEFCLD